MWSSTLGVTVALTNQEFAVFLDTIRDPVATPQIYRLGWCTDYPDANNFTREVFGAGGSQNPNAPDPGGIGWFNQEFEDLIRQAAAERDPAARVELYAQAEELLVNTDAAIIPIYWYTDLSLTKPYVIRSYPVTGHNDFTDWDIAQ
jgi:oligopeptide transport system substrate-binding protein